MSDTDDKRANWTLPIVLLVSAVGFLAFAAWYRMGGAPTAEQPDEAAPAPVAPEPVTFEDALAYEADTFGTTCSLCHDLPHAKLYDELGWQGIGRKMKERMAERMDVAVIHLMRDARPTIRFPPLAALSGPPPASQPTGVNAPQTRNGGNVQPQTLERPGSSPSREP